MVDVPVFNEPKELCRRCIGGVASPGELYLMLTAEGLGLFGVGPNRLLKLKTN